MHADRRPRRVPDRLEPGQVARGSAAMSDEQHVDVAARHLLPHAPRAVAVLGVGERPGASGWGSVAAMRAPSPTAGGDVKHSELGRSRHRMASVSESDRIAWALVCMRVLMGVLWLANLTWKLPPDFGRDQPAGAPVLVPPGGALRRRRAAAALHGTRRDPAFHAVRVAGVRGRGWSRACCCCWVAHPVGRRRDRPAPGDRDHVLTVRAPHQWFWGFALFIASALLVVVPANMRFSVDRRQGRA